MSPFRWGYLLNSFLHILGWESTVAHLHPLCWWLGSSQTCPGWKSWCHTFLSSGWLNISYQFSCTRFRQAVFPAAWQVAVRHRSFQSNNAWHVMPSTLSTTTGYVTASTAASNICWGSLSQIDVWCFPPHFWQLLVIQHSAIQCMIPVQLKHSLFSLSFVFLSAEVTILSQSTDLCPLDPQ